MIDVGRFMISNAISGLRATSLAHAIAKTIASACAAATRGDSLAIAMAMTAVDALIEGAIVSELIRSTSAAKTAIEVALMSDVSEIVAEADARSAVARAKGSADVVSVKTIAQARAALDKISAASSLVRSPRRVAEVVAKGIASGKSETEIAKQLARQLEGDAAAAARVARGAMQSVHNEAQERVFAEYADEIAGFQIVAVLDGATRPAHAARHGTIYWKSRAPLASSRPRLPDDYNCRCTYAPVLKRGAKMPLKGLTPMSTRSYEDYFRALSTEDKIKIVGKARWAAMEDKVKRPQWADFVSSKTGTLLDADHLQRTPKSGLTRKRATIQKVVTKRKRQARAAAR